jgi:hypothetical protein
MPRDASSRLVYNGDIMRRNILIFLGLLTALLPYMGFPYDVNKWIWTITGFVIVAFLIVPLRRRGVHHRENDEARNIEATPRSLHVERREVDDRAGIHIERETITDTERIDDSPNTDIVVEKQVTVMRRRKQKISERIPSSLENMLKGDTQTE